MNKAELERALKKVTGKALKQVRILIPDTIEVFDIDSVFYDSMTESVIVRAKVDGNESS